MGGRGCALQINAYGIKLIYFNLQIVLANLYFYISGKPELLNRGS